MLATRPPRETSALSSTLRLLPAFPPPPLSSSSSSLSSPPFQLPISLFLLLSSPSLFLRSIFFHEEGGRKVEENLFFGRRDFVLAREEERTEKRKRQREREKGREGEEEEKEKGKREREREIKGSVSKGRIGGRGTETERREQRRVRARSNANNPPAGPAMPFSFFPPPPVLRPIAQAGHPDSIPLCGLC